MAITISVTDANGDGKGIDFSAYLAKFEKTYVDASGRSGFNGAITGSYFDTENPLTAAGYATTNDLDGGGQSVLFGSSSGFVYSASQTYDGVAHNVYGTLTSITFGSKTKITELDDANDSVKYTNVADIKITGFPSNYVTTVGNDGEILHDLVDADTSSLIAFLKSDSIVFKGSSGKDVFTSYGHADKLSGGEGSDTLNGGSGNDTVSGGAGNDTLSGAAGVDMLKGNAGNDKLNGGNRNDKLSGDAGKDALVGGIGNDRLDGGADNDTLTGNAGADTFYFARRDGSDKITDFQAGQAGKDVIEFQKGLFDSYADIIDNAVEKNGNTLIHYTGGTLTLVDVSIDDLVKNDFHLL